MSVEITTDAQGSEITSGLIVLYEISIGTGTNNTLFFHSGKDLDGTDSEKDLIFDDLLNADEAFYSGTAVEITPITKVNEFKISSGSIGPITEILQRKYSEIVCGQDKKYSDWLTAI